MKKEREPRRRGMTRRRFLQLAGAAALLGAAATRLAARLDDERPSTGNAPVINEAGITT